MMMTADDVEAALVEAMRVWLWGSQRRGSPWAGDGPWHLFRPAFSERYNAHDDLAAKGDALARAMAAAVSMPRPDRDMIDRAELAATWLSLVTDDIDRLVVVKVITAFAVGRKRAPWATILRQMGLTYGAGGLQRRYSRAIGHIVRHLSV